MALDDFLANSKAYPRAWIVRTRMKTLKNLKNAVVILWVDADPVVADRKNPMVPVLPGVHVNARRPVTAKLDGIADDILKELQHLRRIHGELRQGLVSDNGPSFLNARLEIVDRLAK
jgi:hypothetical protein